MAGERFPKPYVDDVKKDEALMIYVPFDNTEIGARKSGMPKSASQGPKSLEHVGSTAGSSGKKG
jgi:hypothetical protein